MGGFLGLGHSSAKTDRKTQLQGFTDLNNLFNFGLDTSKQQLASSKGDISSGTGSLDTALDFWKKRLSGNRTELAQAVAPEANAVQATSDAARRQRLASGTARGGGQAGTEQTSQDRVNAELDNLIFGVRPQAAGQVAEIGKARAGIGLAELNAALGFGGLAEGAASTLTHEAGASRAESFAQNQTIQKQITDRITGVLGAFI